MSDLTAEHIRLDQDRQAQVPWKKWGPYLSERQWGTVREDYSTNGDAWNYLTHDQARSRAPRWGEDGLAGICDDQQLLCFALALWNGVDPILKERLFGLTNSEGNHGEVKEYYPDFKVECPTGSGKLLNLQQVSTELAQRVIRIFTRQNGARPVYGSSEKFQKDPYWRDLILFYEYFHGDNGAGIGASHQTGWTGLVARLIQITVNGLFEFPDKPDEIERPVMHETRSQRSN